MVGRRELINLSFPHSSLPSAAADEPLNEKKAKREYVSRQPLIVQREEWRKSGAS